MNPVQITQGNGPIVFGMPHTGTYVPPDVQAALNDAGRALADTDWHIDRLYDRLLPNATTVRATFHRYVIDANRAPSDESLYPGQNTTGLCPLTDFDGRSIYHEAKAPDDAEIASRRAAFHAPYHTALEAELNRVQSIHGVAILFDCHSIRSRIPYLFDGTLPDLNIGTNLGATCAPVIERAASEICHSAQGFSAITNGRFRGGWTTRHYGQPSLGRHAIQLEIAQSTYMEDSAPWTWREERAARLRPVLATLLARLETLALNGDLT